MAIITNIQSPSNITLTKEELDVSMAGINFLGTKPTNPQHGDIYVDQNTYHSYVWVGTGWVPFGSNEKTPSFTAPTKEQLEKHPALKQAWEEFLVIKKLVGV